MLDLADRDAVIAQLDHRRRSLPQLARLAELGAQRKDVNDRRIELQTTVDDLTREQRKADTEVEQVKARKQRDEERLNSGAVNNPKDLENIQHELVALDRRIGVLEDAELEIMEQLESAEGELSVVVEQLAGIDASIAEAETERDQQVAVLDEQAAAALSDRKDMVVLVPDDLLALYEKIRAQYGSGAAVLRARRCEGCRLELNGSDIREIAATPEDTVVRCPECSRILVRTDESGL